MSRAPLTFRVSSPVVQGGLDHFLLPFLTLLDVALDHSHLDLGLAAISASTSPRR